MEIHITQQLQSATLNLPELLPLVGRQVEIIIREVEPAESDDPWAGLKALAGQDLVDPDAYKQLRELDLRQPQP